jgi:hypothetical protein
MLLDSILDIGSKIIDRIIPDKQAAEQAKLKLLEMQQNGQLEELKTDMADRDSARKREMEVKDNTNRILAYIITFGFFALIFLLATKYVDITGEDKELLYILIGALAAKFSDVFAYYFGSSSSSRKKDDLIQKIKSDNS